MKNEGKATFSFGKPRASLILPREQASGQPEPPIRWMAVDFVCSSAAEKLDIDVHAFVFTHEGEYIDCVFYKNPVLAGKGIRLQDTTLYLDLLTLPGRAGFVVVTLAVYSGGTLLDLRECSTEVRAYIPKDPLAVAKPAPGKFPSPVDHWEALLATMDITSQVIGAFPDAKGFLDCLLVEEDGNWFLKALMRPVAAFTPQVLIESAQKAVLKYRSTVDHDEETFALPLGELLQSAKEGKTPPALLPAKSYDDLSLQMGEFDRLSGASDSEVASRDKGPEETSWSDNNGKGGRGGDSANAAGQHPSWGEPGYSARSPRPDGEQTGTGGWLRRGEDAGLAERRSVLEAQRQGMLDILEEFMEPSEMEVASTEGEEQKTFETPRHSARGARAPPARARGERAAPKASGARLRDSREKEDSESPGWKREVEERLGRLERGLADVTRAVQQVATGTKEMNVKMQKWFAVTVAQLEKIQRGGAGVPVPVGESERDEPASLQNLLQAMDLAVPTARESQDSVRHQLREIDQRLTLGERNQQHISQTLSELKMQLAGVERRLGNGVLGSAGNQPAVPQLVVDELVVVDDGAPWNQRAEEEDGETRDEATAKSHRKGASRRRRCCDCRCGCCTGKGGAAARSTRTPCACSTGQEVTGEPLCAEGRDFVDMMSRTQTVLKNVEKIDRYGEELGDLLRCLASCTAPDGLKGLDPIERKLYAFAGTPKTFEALHTFETALDRLRVKGIGLLDSPRKCL
ncbi:conserved hypothetical protein [Neospora caninum Liverpool]|uniref:Uncharacterized protein n=1 Tax=Neospora caninum (strain Liverpool) TaxID=572307 RepID=F0V7Q5_NEOCL|nr:conserved hypothetical protein [Neospora caninum Liverpool]CBZ49746.1 conserved hypothetical protein [Neospora caninum Liverpool]CEL64330.1 TPA: hypothetical protein BN1204_002330 [Neospora caninum Liverpool]|eukprot:XP_003879781.1 conserved hypothetical protein [Neospora caninum Liverpool]